MRVAALSLMGAGLAGPARAHDFGAGADALGEFLDGASVILTFPGLLLPLMALGLLLSLWREDGLPTVWPVFLFAQLAGVFAAALVGPGVALCLLGLGVAIAGIAALGPSAPGALAFGGSGLVGVFTTLTAFEGHGLFELPVFTHLGVLFGINLATAVMAGLTTLTLTRFAVAWTRILWRVAASWVGAILMLTLAFEMTGLVS